MGKSGVLMSSDTPLTDILMSMITAIVQHTGIREREIIAIRMHPSLYFHLRRELGELGMGTILDVNVKEPQFMGIPIIQDVDVWLTFEHKPRIGWP